MELTTSLRLCRERDACEDQYTLLANALGPEWGDDRPIPLTMLLDLNAGPGWTGFSNALWALRAVTLGQTEIRDRRAAAFSAQVMGFLPGPPTHWRACRTLREYSMGQASREAVQHAAKDARASWMVLVRWGGKGADAARHAWHAWHAWATRADEWPRAAWAAWATWDVRWPARGPDVWEPQLRWILNQA